MLSPSTEVYLTTFRYPLLAAPGETAVPVNYTRLEHVAFRVRNNKLVQQSSAECLRITLDSAEGDTEEDMSERKRHEQLGNERS